MSKKKIVDEIHALSNRDFIDWFLIKYQYTLTFSNYKEK